MENMFIEYITLPSGLFFLMLSIVLLLRKTPDNKSNKFLSALFVSMAIYSSLVFFHYYALEHNHHSVLLFYSPIDGIFLLSMGPCLYFYILSLLNKPLSIWNWKLLIHFVPFIPYILFNIYFISLPFSARIDWLIHDFNSGTLETNLLNIILYLQIITYLTLSYRLVNKQIKLKDKIKFRKVQYNISWMKTYLVINLLFMILSIPLCFTIANERTNIIIGQIAMDIQFIYMFFKWTLYSEPLPSAYKLESALKKNSIAINPDVADKHLDILTIFMKEKKPYLDENCNIQQIAEQSGILTHQLSNMLNIHLQQSFPDYINEYR